MLLPHDNVRELVISMERGSYSKLEAASIMIYSPAAINWYFHSTDLMPPYNYITFHLMNTLSELSSFS